VLVSPEETWFDALTAAMRALRRLLEGKRWLLIPLERWLCSSLERLPSSSLEMLILSSLERVIFSSLPLLLPPCAFVVSARCASSYFADIHLH